MKLDSTLTISIILALVALIAPIFTAWINNRHALKMKKLEIKQQHYEQNTSHVKELFEQFLADYATFTATYRRNDQAEVQKSFYKCIPYVPSKYLDSFIYFYQLLTLTNTPLKKADEYMQNKLLNEIRDILKTL